MSYCRKFDGSDIYLYGDMHYNGICCMWCCLKDKTHIEGEIKDEIFKGEVIAQNVILKTYSDAISHMEEHRHTGDRAPYKRVIEKLKKDQAKEGDVIDYSSIREDMDAESKRDNYIWNPLRGQFRWG